MSEISARHFIGILAEFDTPDALLTAALSVASAGYKDAEAYTPFRVEGLADALGHRRSRIAAVGLIAGILGALTGFGMCWYANVISFPINIGGRPFNSWPAWIPITFELTVLFSALAIAIGMIGRNGLPRLSHPLFNVEGFERSSIDRYFLCIHGGGEPKDVQSIITLLNSTNPLRVEEIWQ